MPREVFGADHVFLPRDELLTFEEIVRVVSVFVDLGVTKLRLTGGEPLLRRNLVDLVGMLSQLEGLKDMALTTNGVHLAKYAQQLADAGLGRVTVSLDALDDETFRKVADTTVSVETVLEGIAAAVAAGLRPVKVNTVVQRGVNDHQIEALAAWARDASVTLRFIEFMDVGTSNGWVRDRVVSAEEIYARVNACWPLESGLDVEDDGPSAQVAEQFQYKDGCGELGIVASVTRPFCRSCVRARLSAKGELYTCLFASSGQDLRSVIRHSTDDDVLRSVITDVWGQRSDRASELRTETGLKGDRVEMSYIGG